MASYDQKLRTLYLMNILLERTDDDHMLNASELCTILEREYGISTDRRTIYTEILSKYVFIVNRPKTENEMVYYNVDYIHTAIYENKEIRFHYAEWTVKKELKLKKQGAFYVVSPWALTWDDENYYLVAYDAAAGIIKHYRVDKMLHTEILETERKGEESFRDFDLASFAKKTFGMYGGADEKVTLECKKELAGVIIDRFGHDVWLIPRGEEYFRTRVLVSVSPQFFGWLTGIGSGMRIVGPENVKVAYQEYLKDILGNYEGECEEEV